MIIQNFMDSGFDNLFTSDGDFTYIVQELK